MSIILAILCAIVAHLFHAARWGLFITPFGETRNSYLYYSLSVGYLVNLVIPFRIGELVRSFLLYKKTQINFSYILGTVIFDRIFDLIFISILYACLLLTNIIKDFVYLDYAIYSTGIVFFLFLILRSKVMRKIIYQVSDIFNDRIKLNILSFSWSLHTIMRILLITVNKRTFFIYTFAMWIFYIASLSNLVWFFSTENFSVYFKTVFLQAYSLEVYQQSLIYSMAQSISSFSEYSLIMTFCLIMFIWSTPLVIIIGYAYSRETIEKQKNILSNIIKRSRGIFFQGNGELKILPFSNKNDQLKFLKSYFISENIEDIIAIHEINQNVNILEDLTGGSGATTNLIIKNKNLLVRKYALGSASHKLKIQYQWLKKYQELLPVTKLASYIQKTNCFLYDMEYDSSCLSFFNYIHSHSINDSWSIIESIFNIMESKLYSGTEQKSLESNLQSYIKKKYFENINIINSNQKLSRLYNYETITINGNEYKNLKYFRKYFSIEYLSKLLFNDKCSEIHGDITIENIVHLKDSFDRYYLIDPNPENIYNHKYIDYAKMRQSLNMGFEYLNAVPYIYCTENNIEFQFTITDRYVNLLERFDQYVHSQFDNKGFKSVLFHEIVNYARLLPYKFRFEPENTIMYYAIFLMLHNSFYDEYYEK